MLQIFDLPCSLGDQIFSHSFLILPNYPTPLLGRDLLTKLVTHLILQPQASFLGILKDSASDAQPSPQPPEILKQVPSLVWDSNTVRRASHLTPVTITVRDPFHFPHHSQYPIKLEDLRGLKPLIDKFLNTGLLRPTNSLITPLFCPLKRQMAPIF